MGSNKDLAQSKINKLRKRVVAGASCLCWFSMPQFLQYNAGRLVQIDVYSSSRFVLQDRNTELEGVHHFYGKLKQDCSFWKEKILHLSRLFTTNATLRNGLGNQGPAFLVYPARMCRSMCCLFQQSTPISSWLNSNIHGSMPLYQLL